MSEHREDVKCGGDQVSSLNYYLEILNFDTSLQYEDKCSTTYEDQCTTEYDQAEIKTIAGVII